MIIPLTRPIFSCEIEDVLKQAFNINVKSTQDITNQIKIFSDIYKRFTKHLFFGFFVVHYSEIIFEIKDITNLEVTTKRTKRTGIDCAIVTGSLDDWKDAIINGSSLDNSFEYRELMCEFLIYFDKINLGFIFKEYKRKQEKGTILLEKK